MAIFNSYIGYIGLREGNGFTICPMVKLQGSFSHHFGIGHQSILTGV